MNTTYKRPQTHNSILNKISGIFTLALALVFSTNAMTQDSVYYSGKTMVNVDYHHGQIPLAKGVHNIQVLRANRQHPDMAEDYGWTYNHAPNMAYWNNQFFVEYLSDSVSEHVPPSQSYFTTSKDGYIWTKPMVAFPPYHVPDGTTKEGVEGVAKDLIAIMHQRMGFYVAKDGRLLMLAFYGYALTEDDGPNDGKGIGRVVREINEDGSLGPIYFIHYNKTWNAKNTDYPFYKKAKDKGFVKACDELMSNPYMMQQWNEEADHDDPLIPQNKQYKAFCYYTLDDNRVVGLWKYALFCINDDGGKTWEGVRRAPGFVNKNAKIWGQKTSDGKFATVYNPSEFRWPLALSVSDDGLEYKNLLLVNGEISSMRYGGLYKSYGPQYVRGIIEGNGKPADNNMWVTYSMNKEDIWVSKIPIPVEDKQTTPVNDVFNNLPTGKEMDEWNIFSPLWASVSIENNNNKKVLTLHDKDPYDYAKAERLIPESTKGTVAFTITPKQNDNGLLHIEFQNAQGNPAIRIVFNDEGKIMVKDGYRMNGVVEYNANETYNIKVEYNVTTRFYTVYVNGEKKIRRQLFNPVTSIERIMFRTGEVRRFPNADTPTDPDYDLENPGTPVKEAVYMIESLKTL